MGRVVDETEVEESACKVYGNGMVFSKGVLGPLRESQVEKYCPEKVQMPESGKLEEQWNRVSLISSIGDVCLEKGVSDKDFPACVKTGGELIGSGYSRKDVEKRLAKEFGVEVD